MNPTRSRKPKGFSLIVTVSLMVLLSMLAVGMLSLSSIALRGSHQGRAMAEARANARLALMHAVGELQEQFGPDQRISASASILSEATSSAGDVANPNWVGAWNSWRGENRYIADEHSEDSLMPDLSKHREDSFRQWLVSSNDPEDPSKIDFAKGALSGDSIVLVGNGTLGDEADRELQVRAPRVLVKDPEDGGNPRGAYAWWVGDESQKGSIRAGRDEDELKEEAEVVAEIDAPSSVAEELIAGFAEALEDEELRRASVSRQTVGLIEGADEAGKAYHDFTVHARSVMADVREGGLKRDLNLMAERFDADFQASTGLPVSDEYMLYDFGDLNRVPLHDLLTYYSLYKARPAGSRGALVADGRNKPYTSNISKREWSSTPDAMTTALYRQPVLVKTQLAIWARADRSSTNTRRPYRLKIRFTPILTLWNPYNVPLKMNQNSGDALRLDIKGVSADFAVWPNYRQGNDAGRESSSLGGLASSGGDTNASEDLARLVIRDRVEFAPGEVKVFSLNQKFSNMTDVRELKAGYWPISGNEVDYYDVMASRGGAAYGKDSDQVTFTGNQIIGVGFAGGTEDANATRLKHSQGVAVEVMPNTDPETTWRTQALYSRRTSQYRPDAQAAAKMNEFNQLVFELGSQLDGEQMKFRTGTGSYIRRPYSIQNLESAEGEMVGIFTYGVAGEHEVISNNMIRQPRFPSRPFLHSLSTAASPWIQDVTTAALYNLGWAWRIEDGEESSNEVVVDGVQGRFGGGWSVAYGQSRVVQFEVPQRPFHSLSMFTNAALGGWSISRSKPDDKSTGLNAHEITAAHGQGGLFPAVSMPIGNSYANPLIASDKAFTTWTTRKYDDGIRSEPFVDHSYLANHALWDEYFMSSIADQNRGLYASGSFEGRTASAMCEQFFGEERAPLPNRRFVPVSKKSWDDLRPELFASATRVSETAFETVARHLMLEGGFNVNSTSVDAWAAMLGSLRGVPEPVLPASSGSQKFDLESHDGKSLIPNFSISTAPAVDVGAGLRGDSYSPEQWVGSFTLEDDEVRDLAEEIVKQVKLRGPFLSLSDFVNRQLTRDSGLARWGTLQAAIEAAGLNDPVNSSRSADLSQRSEFLRTKRLRDSDPIPFGDAAKGAVVQGSAAYVDQADVLRAIDAQLVPRGDTFVVRTCGQALDASGKVVARAYCEAVVQRTPDYLDSGDLPETRAADLKSETNQRFGRRFEVVSFRWLSPEEV